MPDKDYSTEIDLLEKATAAIDAALKSLAARQDPALHLPAQDLQIANRFIDLARKLLNQPTP